MYKTHILFVAAVVSLAQAHRHNGPAKMDNLVTFGDSYTDESRLAWFGSHNGQPPPPGTRLPPSNMTATGGKTWGRIVVDQTGVNYNDYAISGATCSNEIINRYLASINAPFPSVVDYQVPAFQADIKYKSLYPHRTADNTVYALWIGTNDLGVNAFIADSQVRGTDITDYIDCMWTVFDGVYKTGGRRFVLLNVVPLERSPLYASVQNGGAAVPYYWPNKADHNTTEIQYKMLEYTTSVNTMIEYGGPFQLLVKKRWPGATFQVFDVNSLFLDIVQSPDEYLAAPGDVTGYVHHCNQSSCTDAGDESQFLWWDELHPTQQTSGVVASEFLKVLQGRSKYGTTYHC